MKEVTDHSLDAATVQKVDAAFSALLNAGKVTVPKRRKRKVVKEEEK